MRIRRLSLAVALLSTALAAAPASAAVQRTFVASFGNDANPCSISSPCRTFAAALAQTSLGGEIVVLDSAGYGGVTITQSVSIIAPTGVYGGISVFPGFDGIVINGAGIEVTLRGLAINGQGGTVGINLLQGTSLVVENCTVTNMNGDGIRLGAVANVAVRDTVVRRSLGRGIHIPTGGTMLLDRVRVDGSSQENLRVRAETGEARVHVRDSVFTSSQFDGVSVTNASSFAAHVVVERTSVLRSAGIGIFAIGAAPGLVTVAVTDSAVSEHQFSGIIVQGDAGTVMRVSGSIVNRNGGNSFLNNGPSSQFVTFQNNSLSGNGAPPNGTITTQALQ